MVIQGVGDRTLPPVFRGLDQVIHFPGCHIMVMEIRIAAGPVRQVLMESHHRFAQQNLMAILDRAVSVKLDEEPIRPSGDLNPRFEPEIEAINMGRLTALNAAILDDGKEAPPAPAPVEHERSLNQQQAVGWRWPDTHVETSVMRPRPLGIVDRIIDGVDLARLRPAGSGRKCEIGIAPRLTQDIQLVVDTAPPAIGSRVIQRPVTVDKPKSDLSGSAVPRQEPVLRKRV